MTVASFGFFGFFLLSLLIYYVIPKCLQWIGLLLFSLCFFIWAAPAGTIAYLAIGIFAVWFSALGIERARAWDDSRRAKRALALGIAVNVGILATLKYNGFFIRNSNALSPFSIPLPDLAAPIGISFYTLSAVGYLLNCYWGLTAPQKSLAKTALFVGYWPILTSGPILRYEEMADRLFRGHDFNYRTITFGLQRLLWGLFQKLVIAPRLGVAVDTIYGAPTTYPGFYIWLAAALFMLQLYTDFSGCMDIIIGASECYGVKLPENFRTPFFSRSIQEFWQRWHITLGAWLRDFVLFPVLRTKFWKRMTKRIREHWGKQAAKQIPTYLGMLCVWLLMGLWHGGAWKYVIGMGLWFWACIVLANALEPLFKKIIALLQINTHCFSWHLFQSLRVFALVCIGTMFFRLDSLQTTFSVMRQGLHFNNPYFVIEQLPDLFGGRVEFDIVVIGLALLLLVSVLRDKQSLRERLAEQNLMFRWIILIALIFFIIFAGMYGPGYITQDFIYERF